MYFSRLPDASAFTSVPLTANPGPEGEPSFSPDGTQIAYSWDEGATGDHETQASHIYVKLIGEGKPLRVTAGTQLDTSPAWSPDGRWIAFARKVDRGGGIYLVPALGGRERLVTTAYLPSRQLSSPTLSWSPDSRSLAIAESTSPELPASLSLINVESGMRTQLTRSTDAHTVDTNPVFSPDGRRLLFTRCGLPCQLYIVNLGKDYHPLADPRPLSRITGSVVPGAAWTPNGLDIVYSLNDSDYRASLFRIRNGNSARALQFKDSAPQLPSLPAIAPRGNLLAYVDESEDFQIWRVDQGRPARRFVFSSRIDETPQYSPDGRRVAFASNRSGRIHQIWLCDADGSDPVQLTHFDQGDSGTPRWAPDARSIVFDHFTQQGWRVFIIGSDGTRLRRLTSENAFEAIPSWSADGRWIYYTSDRSGRHEIWKASAQGGKGVRVTRHSGYTAFDCAARRSLIYTKVTAAGIWELPLEGGQEKLLLPSGGGEREFAVAPEGVYYLTAPGTNGFRSVRFQSFTSNETKLIASLNVATAEGLAVSPDRQTILFTAATRSASNIMIVGNFH